MVEVSVSDKEKILVDSFRRAPANVKRDVQTRDHNAGLVAAYGNPFDRVAFHVHPLPLDLRPGLPVLLLLLHRPVNHREEPRPLQGQRPEGVSVAAAAAVEGID